MLKKQLPTPPLPLTLCPEGLPAEVTLVRPLAAVDAQVDVQVVLLGEGVAAQAAQEGTLVPGGTEDKRWVELALEGAEPQMEAPVDGFDVHLQAVATGRPVAALLAHERLLSAVLGSLVHAQLRASQEGFGTLGTLWEIPASVHVVFSLTACVPSVRGGKTHRVGFGVTVSLHHVQSQTFLAHKLVRTNGTLQKMSARQHARR